MRPSQRIVVPLLVGAIALIGPSVSLHAQDARALPEPNLRVEDESFYVHYYGDARNVQWMADLLKDADPLVRERAVMDLGQTDNRQAAQPVLAMLKDPDLGVRCTALGAIVELDPNLARPLVSEAMGDSQRTMVLTALRLAASLRWAESRAPIEKLLSRDDALIVSSALDTLTHLGLPAPAEPLKTLLESPQAPVRLRAVQNALLAPPANAPVQSLLKIAGADEPQIRACAMAALGKPAYSSVEPLLLAAARGDNAALRRGALWGWRYAGKADRIRPFLDDESPMVVLAAIEAAGELKCADCAARLTELLASADDDREHLAARAALVQIGQDEVPKLAAERLRRTVSDISGGPEASGGGGERPTSGPSRRRKGEMASRNVRSFAWILGQYRSAAALDVQADLMRKLPVSSLAVTELSWAMARTGDERAQEPIRQALRVAAQNAPSYLRFKRTGLGGHEPFEEIVTAALVEAAAELKDAQSVPTMLRLIEMEDQGVRLSQSAAAAARSLPRMVNETNRAAIEKAIVGMLGRKDRAAHGMESTFEACKAAVRLNLSSAVPLLQEVLAEHANRQLIHASAWAIGQLTKTVPPLPEPSRYQGKWIVRAAEK